MPPKQTTVVTRASPIGMTEFAYNSETASIDWSRWIKRFEIYLLVQGIDRSSGEDRALALQHLLFLGGPKVFDIYDSIVPTDSDHPTTYEQLKTACLASFTYSNPMVDSILFRAAKQMPSENLNDWATRLKSLGIKAAITADTLESEVLKVITQNTTDIEVRLKGLDKAMKLATLLEWSTAQRHKNICAQALENQAAAFNVNAIEQQQPYKRPPYKPTTPNTSNKTCNNCGYAYPHAKQCPAKGQMCKKCGKANHFARVCRSDMTQNRNQRPPYKPNRSPASNQDIRTISSMDTSLLQNLFNDWYEQKLNDSNVITDNHDEDQASMNMISTSPIWKTTTTKPLPRAYIKVGETKFLHLLDSGSNINVLSRRAYEALLIKPYLRASQINAFAFLSSTKIPILGEMTLTINHDGNYAKIIYQVIDGQSENILGFAAIENLKLITMNVKLVPHIMTAPKIANIDIDWKDPIKCFPTLFTDKIGKLNTHLINLEVRNDVKQVQQPSYPVPYHLKELFLAKLNLLESNNIISKAKQGEKITWLSPAHPVAKFDSLGNLTDVRVTCNNKQINKALILQKRHIPSLPEILYGLNDVDVFSKLDFKEAFNQLVLNDESRTLTGMTTEYGIYFWNCLNMGLAISSEIFQQTMHTFLGNIPGVRVVHDDVLVATKGVELHKIALQACLNKIREIGMTLNKLKCKFFVNTVEFFGMVISKYGVRLKKDKIADLLNAEEPKTLNELQSFLGLSGYFKSRTPKQSEINAPLRRLLTRNKKFDKLSQEEKTAFNRLKTEVQDSLDHFDRHKATHLHTDAGPDGCSAFLLQNKMLRQNEYNFNPTTYDDLDHKLIKCDSHSYSEAEANYSQVEKEAFACVWAIKLNHNYLYGRPFTCHTDALAVKRIFEEDKIRKRIPLRFVRWKSEIAAYNVTFVHRAGVNNIADFLSRRFKREKSQPLSLREINIIQYDATSNWPTIISIEQLVRATKEDASIQNAIENVHHYRMPKKDILKPYAEFWHELRVTPNKLLIRNDQIIVPTSLQQQVIREAHDSHQGSTKTIRFLRSFCWFPNMALKVEQVVKDCWPCQTNTNNKTQEPLLPTQMIPEIWHTIAIDFGSMSPTGEYNLNFKDENTRRIVIEHTNRLTSEAAIVASKAVFEREGTPKVVKTDNGPAFISAQWNNFAKKVGFHHRKITPLHPRANGMIEVTMKLNNKAIRIAKTTNGNWKNILKKLVDQYNSTPHTATKFAPNALAKKQVNFNILPTFTKPIPHEEMMKQAMANDAKYKLTMKTYTDKRNHAKPHKLQLNDPVLHHWLRPTKYTPLLNPKPYRVENVNRSMITARNDEHSITRNSSHFKKITEKCYEQATNTTQQQDKMVWMPKYIATTAPNTPTSPIPITPLSMPTPILRPQPTTTTTNTPTIAPRYNFRIRKA